MNDQQLPAPSPFSPAKVQSAIQQALITNPVPAGKNRALVVMAGTEGVKAVIAAKVGEHWTYAGEAEWHAGGDFSAGAQVTASW